MMAKIIAYEFPQRDVVSAKLDQDVLTFKPMAPRSILRKALHVDYDFVSEERLILRDHLALVRTRLANERTLMSYIRSTLYLLLGGMALLQIKGYSELQIVGYFALGLSAILLFVGMYRYVHLRRGLTRYYAAFQKQERSDRTTTGPEAVS